MCAVHLLHSPFLTFSIFPHPVPSSPPLFLFSRAPSPLLPPPHQFRAAIRLRYDFHSSILHFLHPGPSSPPPTPPLPLLSPPHQFRAAIRLRYDFHRAIYNLGTVLVCAGMCWYVLYGLAEDTMKQAKSKTGVMPDRTTHPANEVYSQSAVYIAAAHALKADYPVYSQSAVYVAAAHALKADYPVSVLSGELKEQKRGEGRREACFLTAPHPSNLQPVCCVVYIAAAHTLKSDHPVSEKG
ncbi:unnamed protein product [Closterium sp. NIES-53]